MKSQVLAIIFFFHVAVSFPYPEPAKLLRVPKIYNALITTKQKLLPSEAYPATTGQVFEPIGLSGEPVLLNPEAFSKKNVAQEETDFAGPEQPRGFTPSKEKKEKMPTPVVFYPRYSVYQPYNPLFPYTYPYQQPFVYSPLVNNEGPAVQRRQEEPVQETQTLPPEPERRIQPKQEEPQEREEEEETPEEPIGPSEAQSSFTNYFKNNRPKNLDIPDVPPPPPPVGAPRPQQPQNDDS